MIVEENKVSKECIGIILPVHTKGAVIECQNYKGKQSISLPAKILGE